MPAPVFDLEALLSVPGLAAEDGFDLSPDGKRLAFTWNASGRWEIYVIPMDGPQPVCFSSGAASLRPVSGGPGAKYAPHWSPDGRRLAYVADMDGSEAYDVYVYDLASDVHTNLTPDTPEAIQPTLSWSPDGQWIAFASDRSDCFRAYVLPAAGGEARCVFDLPYPVGDVLWSPGGRWLAVVAETLGQDYGIFIAPAMGGEAHPVTLDGDPLCAMQPCWSPDGCSIAFVSDRPGQCDIGQYDLATGGVVWLAQEEGDKASPAWSPDGRRLAYVADFGPTTTLHVLSLDKPARPQVYRLEPGIHHPPRFTPDGRGLLFTFESSARPNDLWRLDLQPGGADFRQITCSLPPGLTGVLGPAGVSWSIPEHIRYSSLDGASVPALLYRPPGVALPAPALVYVHGGPDWLSQANWHPFIQHMVGRGWVVLAPNYRGSIGYGRAWQLANRFDLGGGDTMDVTAGADYLVRAGLAAAGRVAVTGRSWGGYLTMTCLTRYPERWAAGSAVAPFLNWFTGHTASRPDVQRWDLENMGDPQTHQALWRERSPFFFLDRIRAPVQLICGAHDVRCPSGESLQARDVLAAHGKPCDLALYPDEGHTFLKAENVLDAEKRRVAFLAQALELL